MSETVTNSAPEQAVQTASLPTGPKKDGKKKWNRKKVVKRTAALLLTAAVLAGGGYGLSQFLNRDDGELGEIFSQPAMLGMIQSKVSGMGTAQSKDSRDVSLPGGATIQVQDLYVNLGDVVMEGQPLFTYTSYSQAAEDAAAKAQKDLAAKEKEIANLQENRAELTVRAPFAGKLKEVKDFTVDQEVMEGTPVATLVNDRTLKLTLYFSYAFEQDISVGQSVSVSVPAVMSNFTGRVDEIHKVRFISPEGGVHFEVVVAFDNPGTLTEGMDASATLTAADGTAIYPYENGQTEYYEQQEILTKAGGPVTSVGNLHNYADVAQGEALLTMGAENMDETMVRLQEELAAIQTSLDETMKSLGTFDVAAPIGGSIIACNLEAGSELQTEANGQTAIMIADNTVMNVVIQVDDRNISFIKPGSPVDLDWNGSIYTGTVTKIDMAGAQQGQGMTNYPVTLSVDNYDGSLSGGAWLQYSFVTSEALDCITIPAGSLRYFSDLEGNRQSVVFVKRDERPEDVPELEMPTFEPGQPRTFPSEEEGFYPVIVETGLADIQNVEILSGVEEGDEVFVAYTVTDSASNWG